MAGFIGATLALTFADLALAGVYGAWTLICLLVYVPRLQEKIRKHDYFGLVPEWRFFAPNPGRVDYHLLFRDEYRNGTVGNWTEAAPIGQRGAWAMVVNPKRRRNKGVVRLHAGTNQTYQRA
jgi:hypothetical protein